MGENTTTTQEDNQTGLYISTVVSFLSAIIAIFICINIIIIIYIIPNLYTATNLLVSNTCCCSLFYSIITTINIYNMCIQSISTDWSCRIRGYLAYVSFNLIIDSYIIQAISRLSWTVLYKYRYLLTIKCHIYLIICQISWSFLVPLPSLITKDIVYRPYDICTIPMEYKIHILYLLIIGYIIPFIIILILYTIIFRHIIHSRAHFRPLQNVTRRDSEVARNILILLSIFLFGGVPTIIYIVVTNETETASMTLFLIAVTAPSVSVTIEKIMTIRLNKDIQKALQQQWMKCFSSFILCTTPVEPYTNTNIRVYPAHS